MSTPILMHYSKMNSLPFAEDVAKAEATVANGIVRIALPRAA